MRAIVTGANGFVGSALVRYLLLNNVETLAIDIDFSDEKLPDHNLLRKECLSVEKINTLCQTIEFCSYDVFYHFAWIGSAGPLRMDEKLQTQNALWTVECLRTAKKIGCRKFVCAGSIMEYEVQEVIYAQESKPGTSYIYGVGKVLAHELCKPIANELGIGLVWTYITNAYGVGERSPRFINTTLRKIIKGEKLEFTSGTQNYDFIYIDDVVKAFYLVGLHGKANKGYMIGSGNAKPLKEFILEMCKENAHGNSPIFGNIPFTGVNVPIEIFDTYEIKRDCGFTAEISFAEGTKRTLDWLKEIE